MVQASADIATTSSSGDSEVYRSKLSEHEENQPRQPRTEEPVDRTTKPRNGYSGRQLGTLARFGNIGGGAPGLEKTASRCSPV